MHALRFGVTLTGWTKIHLFFYVMKTYCISVMAVALRYDNQRVTFTDERRAGCRLCFPLIHATFVKLADEGGHHGNFFYIATGE